MLKTRIMPTLLYKDLGLVKGRRFDGERRVGTPTQAIKVFNMREVDELVFLDVTASIKGSEPDFDLIDDLADDCFMPLTVGGGVRSETDVRRLLMVGADKVSINSAYFDDPELISRCARNFGSQCVVASIDAKKRPDGGYDVMSHSGTRPQQGRPVEVARDMEDRGAGEILLTSIDCDGVMEGYDIDLIAQVTEAVSIPVIASGGCAGYDDMVNAVKFGNASAVAAASIFQFTEMTPKEAKAYMASAGIPVRR